MCSSFKSIPETVGLSPRGVNEAELCSGVLILPSTPDQAVNNNKNNNMHFPPLAIRNIFLREGPTYQSKSAYFCTCTKSYSHFKEI